MDQSPWKPSAEGGVAWAGTEVGVAEEGQQPQMAVKGLPGEGHLAAAAAATAAVSSVPEIAESHSLRF